MIIRQAKLLDLDQLVVLFEAYRVWYRREAAPEKAKQFLKERLILKDSVILLAIHEGQAVGFTQLYPSFSSTRLARLWILNDLFVAESHRGHQYSVLLIDAAKTHCKETDGCGILLETEVSNIIGNKLYLKTGFHLEENNFYFWSHNS